jgi:hypothetical protein
MLRPNHGSALRGNAAARVRRNEVQADRTQSRSEPELAHLIAEDGVFVQFVLRLDHAFDPCVDR